MNITTIKGLESERSQTTLTIKEFALSKNIGYHKYYYWIRALRDLFSKPVRSSKEDKTDQEEFIPLVITDCPEQINNGKQYNTTSF